jgi:hypothetical protein
MQRPQQQYQVVDIPQAEAQQMVAQGKAQFM